MYTEKKVLSIQKNILLVFMQQNSIVVPTKFFIKSIKFWLFQQSSLLGQQQKYFFPVYDLICFLNRQMVTSLMAMVKLAIQMAKVVM